MYKRQNTSVAYQAPEGKTYVADLRQVYDFYGGQSKTGIVCDPNNPRSLFENTILQDISLQQTSVSPTRQFGEVDNTFVPYGMSQMQNFAQNMYMGLPFNGFPVHYPSSLTHSNSSINSPSPGSSSFNDSSEQVISPIKLEDQTRPSSAESVTVHGVMEYGPSGHKPTLKRKRTSDEMVKIERESQIKKCKRDLKKFDTTSRFLHNDIPPPNVSIAPKTSPKLKKPTYKHSISSILNLDDSEDLVNGPPVIDLAEHHAALRKNSYKPAQIMGSLDGYSNHYNNPYFGMLNSYSHPYYSHLGNLPFLTQPAYQATSKFL